MRDGLDHPKTAKSFRAAADRILRQDTTAAAGLSRLLAAGATIDRVIQSEDDEWSLRLTALASVGHWDAVAVIADAPARTTRTHNVDGHVVFEATVPEAIRDAARLGSAVQLSASIALADGRTAEGVLVVPLRAVRGVSGSLVALRVGRSFGTADVESATAASEIAALEMLRSANAARDTVARRQAFALYELARHALFAEDPATTVQTIVDVLADLLEHDVAQLWSLRTGGSLQLRAAHPREGLMLEIARPRDHAVLARALDGEFVRAHDMNVRSWVSRTTRDLIVAPLGAHDAVSGILVLGRWRRVYTTDDEQLAAASARFIGRALELGTSRGQAIASHAHIDEEPEVTVG